jgi:uncharacterized protein
MTGHTAARATEIPVRRMNFAFGPDVPRHWMGGDPFETQVFNALSITFPRGEKNFIDSVVEYRDRITDPALEANVRGFIGQEGHHRVQHRAFNEWLASFGLPVADIDDYVRMLDETKLSALLPIQRLAVTCAFEHFTAVLAEAFVTDPAMYGVCDERVRALWTWHALEELEHKAVAFDVYEHVGGDYVTRVTTMALVTIDFFRNQARFHYQLMKADGHVWSVGSWIRGMWKYWGPRGAFTKLLPAYLAYYRPSFHPAQHDTSKVLDRWKPYVEERAERITPPAERGDPGHRAAG